MLRTLCCIALISGVPLSAQANENTEIFYEHNYKQSTLPAYNVGIALHDSYSDIQIGLMLTHIPDYSSDPFDPSHNVAFLYIGDQTPGAVSVFYQAGIDIWSIVATMLNVSMEENSCNDYYWDSYNCQTPEFIDLNPNLFFSVGMKLNTRLGSIAIFWRNYWLDDGFEFGRRKYLGVRYSLRF